MTPQPLRLISGLRAAVMALSLVAIAQASPRAVTKKTAKK